MDKNLIKTFFVFRNKDSGNYSSEAEDSDRRNRSAHHVNKYGRFRTTSFLRIDLIVLRINFCKILFGNKKIQKKNKRNLKQGSWGDFFFTDFCRNKIFLSWIISQWSLILIFFHSVLFCSILIHGKVKREEWTCKKREKVGHLCPRTETRGGSGLGYGQQLVPTALL